MRVLVYGLLLLAGFCLADDQVEVGKSYDFTLVPDDFTVSLISCHLKTPHDEVMDFIIGQDHNVYGDRYELRNNPTSILPICTITVKDFSHRDAGTWELSSKATNAVSESKSFNIIVTGDVTESPDQEDGKTWLSPIEFPTRIGQSIDISLSKNDQNEVCYVLKPDGQEILLSEVKSGIIEANGFVVHDASEFVTCRITVGPMTEELLGDWSLCAMQSKTNNNDIYESRCQLVKVTWQNPNSPSTIWEPTIHPKFDHPVHFGGSLSPSVIGNGDIVTCHVITPFGEDLVIDQDSEYPHLKLEPSNPKESPVCSVTIGPIQSILLGDWTIYGKFRSPVMGFNEVRLPISLFLYDHDNPYNQAYNVSNDEITRVVNLGGSVTIDVSATGTVDSCEFTTPSGQFYDLTTQDKFDSASFLSDVAPATCSLSIGPFTEELLGKWNIVGKFNEKNRFVERQLTATILLQDPSNPIEDDRIVENLTEQHFDTKMGKEHRITIDGDVFINPESCHIVTPDGLQHKFIEGFDVPGVEILHETGVECGVTVTVKSEANIGDWTLIARATRHSERIERRLPFTIYVEEIVEAIPQQVNVNTGEHLTVRLKEPTDLYETCKLKAPTDGAFNYEKDLTDVHSCAFKILDLDYSHSGTWEIVYGNSIIYRAPIEVNVDDPTNVETDPPAANTLNLINGDPVDMEVGPENVFYCKIQNPQGFTTFEGFSRCKLTISRVSSEHSGIWTMYLGFSGRVAAETQSLRVNVNNRAAKAVVTTHVDKDPITRSVIVQCQLQSTEQLRSCKFRAPHNRIFLATGSHQQTVTDSIGTHQYQSTLTGNTCSVLLVDPLVAELGLWRCSMETDNDVYYSFMEVLCPWALLHPETAEQVEQEAVLRLDHSNSLNVVSNEPLTMSCSINAPIKYCYFRRQNGTTFAVYPGMQTSSMEYVGLGFDAGECGLKFNNIQSADSGTWSCLVGLDNHTPEQRLDFAVAVNDPIHVELERVDPVLTVRGVVHNNQPLDYCRFVRIDAFGFSTYNMPTQYPFVGNLARGECMIRISNPTILEVHPWTIVAKITGQDGEISRQTGGAFIFEETTPPGELDEAHHQPGPTGFQVFLYVVLSLILVFIIIGLACTPKRHRQWVSARAAAVRSSLRKTPLQPEIAPIPEDRVQPPPYANNA